MAGILNLRSVMPPQRYEDLTERSFRFSCDVYDYCAELLRLGGLAARIAYQLFDAASSVGANRAEAKSAYTRRDFRSKTSISLKEVREANFWLRLADAKLLGDVTKRARLLSESHELISIFVAAVRALDDRS